MSPVVDEIAFSKALDDRSILEQRTPAVPLPILIPPPDVCVVNKLTGEVVVPATILWVDIPVVKV